MIIFHRTHDIINYYLGVVFRNSSALDQVIRQRNAPHELHDYVDVVVVVHALIELNDIRMVHIHQDL